MAFINVLNLPASGYQVRVPETGFVTRIGTGLEDTVNEVQKHRAANTRFGWPTDKNSIRAWVLGSVEARLRAMPGGAGMGWLVPDSPPPDASFQASSRQRQPGRLSGVAAAPAKAMAGIALVADWLGSGLKAAEQPLADARASTCVRCKFNQPASGVQKAYGTVADGLHLLLEARASMKLQTPHDSALHTCQICDCSLALKVFVPIEHVAAHTPKAIYDALWEECWIRREMIQPV